MDPYEQKLFHLFSSHENGNGLIELIGLNNLVQTLQLKERGSVLINLLLKNGTRSGVSFQEFREGLLQVITSEDDETSASTTAQVSPVKPSSDVESDREISPKLIVGTKKYGRRSRPTQNSDELIDDTSDSDNEAAVVPSLDKKSSKVQRSVSQSDVHGAKRRRPMHATKLKRCASLPSHKSSRLEIKVRQHKLELELNEDSMDESDNALKISSLTQNLRDVWNSFQCGSPNTLNIQQLEIVCERVGLNKAAAKLAAEEVFEKLSIKRDAGIRFEQFVKLIQSDADMFSSVHSIRKPEMVSATKKIVEEEESQVYQETSPTWSSEAGTIEMETLIELWTSGNVVEPDELIKNLGFSGKDVKLSELCMVLDEEIQRNTGDTLASLLRASVSLHRAEISSLRKSFRQMADENRKLFADNKEANRRASILAQEIDERHTNLEDVTKTKLKSIELRHQEAIKELTLQLTAERDHIGVLNARLELKIKAMEVEDQKLQQDFASLKDENSALESEQTELHKQITELLEQNIRLNQDIADMEAGGDDGKNDSHNEEMLDLIEKIETLQMENSNLRDKNDELLYDVENLNGEVSRWKNKSKLVPRDSSDEQEATTSAAVKRRGDSPSKSKNVEESPRTGKVRRTSNDVEESDASGDWVALNNELASSTPRVVSYKKRDDEEIEYFRKKVLELEDKVSEYKSKAEVTESTAQESSNVEDMLVIKKENEKLKKRCKELEDNLEQMSKEYENCEDYWQSKVNEERLLFDEDQRQSDDKFAELLQKMTELEDQFAAQTERNNGRLSPIDEKCQLETQYVELENEMEELKVHAQSILDDKSKEIEALQLEISQLLSQTGLKTPPRATSPDSVASSPINYLLNQNTITGPIRDYQNPNYQAKKTDQPDNNLYVEENQEPLRVISPIQKPQSSRQQQSAPPAVDPETNREMLEVCEALSMISNRSIGSNSIQSLHDMPDGTSSPTSVSGAKENIKRMKVFMDQMREEIQELTAQRESLVMELQQLQEAKPILANAYKTTHPNLSQKLEKLQMKNKHLQNVLKQQQHYTETIMYQTWHQQRQELNDLRNRLEAQSIVISEQATRLASADLLVKDLYVENSHLSATIQRMEQQITRQTLMHLAQHHQPKSMGSMGSSLTGMP